MPVLLRYRLSKLFFAEAGVQTNMRLKVHDIYHADIDGSELDYTVKTTDNFTLLDVGAYVEVKRQVKAAFGAAAFIGNVGYGGTYHQAKLHFICIELIAKQQCQHYLRPGRAGDAH